MAEPIILRHVHDRVIDAREIIDQTHALNPVQGALDLDERGDP